jgi:dolichol-phosphate mannosyltransferase
MPPGQTMSVRQAVDFRQALTGLSSDSKPSIDVVIATGPVSRDDSPNETTPNESLDPQLRAIVTHVRADGEDWATLVRAGVNASFGEQLVVMDLGRRYSSDSLARVTARLQSGECDLAVGIPRLEDAGLLAWLQQRFGLGLISRLLLGTSDIFSGLFTVWRSVWEHELTRFPDGDSSLILELLARHRLRCIDVPVPGGGGPRRRGVGIEHIRPLKRLLDLRFGNYSRLVQFCIVGASGMVVDLSFYALFQWLFSFTKLYTIKSDLFGVSWHLAAAGALSIGIALVWNFALNRRLTFNDARKSGLARQFLTYVLSNAVAILFSFSVRLYLPGHIGFFARHKLAAAVVGIVAATGISFSMSRWLVFARKPEPRIASPSTRERARVQTSTLP